MSGPGLFSDIGKRAKDLLTKDYSRDQKLTISTVPASGLEITSTAVKKKRLCTLGIRSVHKQKNSLIDVTMDADSKISTTLTVLDVLPSTNLVISVDLPDNNAGKLELQYFHFNRNASFATVVRMKPFLLKFSGTVGAAGVAFGAEGRYDTATGKFTKYSAAIGVTKKDCDAAFILSNKGDRIKVTGFYYLDEKHKASIAAEFTSKLSHKKNTFAVGGMYDIDGRTAVKARLGSNGRLAALV